MAELYGKDEGCSHGYGGSMHLYDVEVGNLGANAVVARWDPGDRRRCARLPDARTSRASRSRSSATARRTRATFHESLNLAQLWKVPAIFVLENNGWAESTPAKQQLPLPVDELGKRALAYGMKLIEVDGQDVEAVYLAALAAREHAVSGKGPVFLHLRTYRLTGHYVGDPQVYRDRRSCRRRARRRIRSSSCARASSSRTTSSPRSTPRSGRGRRVRRVREGRHRSEARRRAQVRADA